ncbi:hypothetical protein [Pelomonas sp. CA6]|nr:hypothetical protein [Pelomonas sp. CA6]
MKTHFPSRQDSSRYTGLKVLALVATAWGLVYPALLWGLGVVVS